MCAICCPVPRARGKESKVLDIRVFDTIFFEASLHTSAYVLCACAYVYRQRLRPGNKEAKGITNFIRSLPLTRISGPTLMNNSRSGRRTAV
jgi:hypothetical protein